MIRRRKRVGYHIGFLVMLSEDPTETTARWVRTLTSMKKVDGIDRGDGLLGMTAITR